MAPELLESEASDEEQAELTYASDVFALSSVVIEVSSQIPIHELWIDRYLDFHWESTPLPTEGPSGYYQHDKWKEASEAY
jgi:hypothetical protein